MICDVADAPEVKIGSIVTVLDSSDEEWALIETAKGKVYFPKNYIAIINDSGATASDTAVKSSSATAPISPQSAASTSANASKKGRCRVEFTVNPPGIYLLAVSRLSFRICVFTDTGSELGLKVGDVVDLLDSSNADWWLLKAPNGKEGYYPANFLKVFFLTSFTFI